MMTEDPTPVLRRGRSDGGGTDAWTPIAAPGGATLHDVASTATGTYAVGADGVVLKRADRGWRKVLDGVPGCGSADLYGADATDDGRLLWIVGADGAVCEYDVTSGIVTRHEAPAAGRLVDVAATGDSDEATVAVATSDGRVLRSAADTSRRWRSAVREDGAPVALALNDRTVVACVGDRVVEAPPDGPSERLGGPDTPELRGLTVATETTWIVGDDGTICRDDGGRLVRSSVVDAALYDVAATDDEVIAVGAGGAVFVRDGDGWSRLRTDAAADLHAVTHRPSRESAPSAARGAVAVGVDGTVVER